MVVISCQLRIVQVNLLSKMSGRRLFEMATFQLTLAENVTFLQGVEAEASAKGESFYISAVVSGAPAMPSASKSCSYGMGILGLLRHHCRLKMRCSLPAFGLLISRHSLFSL